MTETTENEALEKSGNEEKLTVEDMRKMLIETGLPKLINESVERISAKLPRKPTLPDGVPQNFQEALFTPGVCAIPLWSKDKWRFGVICDGAPIYDSRTNEMVMFDSYDEAMTELQEWNKFKQKID